MPSQKSGSTAASQRGSSTAGKGFPARPRSVTVPSPEDLELAKDDALLQLRIGRSAHYYTVLVSAALVLDAFLVLFLQPTVSAIAHRSIQDTFFLVFPIGAAVYLSFFGLYIKWEVYQLWPWEAHFSTTVASCAFSVLLAVVYVTNVLGEGPFGHLTLLPWFYPLALVGVSLPVVALILTWKGWSQQQWFSLVSAVLPIATAALLYIPGRPSDLVATDLAFSLIVAAVLYQTSGSFLHLISSGTRSHERELITSGQSRMFQLAGEFQRHDEALRFREVEVRKRETDTEHLELSLQRQRESLEEARSQFDRLESDHQARATHLSQQQAEWNEHAAQVNAASRVLKDRELSLMLREDEVSRRLPQLAQREQNVVQREGVQTKRDFELEQRAQDLERRGVSAQDTEARLEARKHEIDVQTQEMLRKEAELRIRESTISVVGETNTQAALKVAEVSQRESKLAQLKAVLDEQNVTLGRKARQLEEAQKELRRSEEEQARREADIASRATSLQQRETESAQRAEDAVERQRQYEAAVQNIESRLKEIELRSQELANRETEIARSEKDAQERVQLLKSLEDQVRTQRAESDRRDLSLRERERLAVARESELNERSRSMENGDLPLAGLAAMAAMDDPSPETARRGGGRRGGVSARRSGSDSGGITDVGLPPPSEISLTVPVVPRPFDQASTGTPRLDDLLSGGIPPKGHLMLVGDAFVGKETVLYAFIAEGLRRGQTVVMITATRSPEEITQSLGTVEPQFKEFDQRGLVVWIDASGSGTNPQPNRFVLKGPDDQAGILSSLVQVAKRLEGEGRSFRVGMLGLAAILAHVEQRTGYAFLQNVVGILKPRPALAMYSLEGGAFTDAQVETLLTRMDGAILFRQDRDKTFLQVRGLGEVQTREWIEYRATDRSLTIGSFSLERIR